MGVYNNTLGTREDSYTVGLARLLKEGHVELGASVAEPAAAGSGRLLLYARSIAGRLMLKFIGPSGLDTVLQPHQVFNNQRILRASSGTTLSLLNMANTAVGTVSTPALASTNLRTQTARATVTSAATANAASELRAAQTLVWRGNAAGLGGFFYAVRFGESTTTALQRGFWGLHSVTGAIATTQDPAALTNIIGIGHGSSDVNLRIMHNDAAGVATQIDLGASFPANSTTALYELALFAPPNAANVEYRVRRLDTGAEATGVLSTDLPANTTFLTRHEYMNNGGTLAAVAFDVVAVGIETDY